MFTEAGEVLAGEAIWVVEGCESGAWRGGWDSGSVFVPCWAEGFGW